MGQKSSKHSKDDKNKKMNNYNSNDQKNKEHSKNNPPVKDDEKIKIDTDHDVLSKSSSNTVNSYKDEPTVNKSNVKHASAYNSNEKLPEITNLRISDYTDHHNHNEGDHLEKHLKINLEATGGSLNKDIRQIYKFKEVLGGGHFGTVRIGYIRDGDPKKTFAIKSISKKHMTPKDLDSLMKEVEILSSLDHPNIIKFYESYQDQFYFHMVMELCKGKEVFDRIIEEGNINEKKVATIIYKVLNAISYCHAAGITHRDLKPENILFETIGSDAEIKLIDFGLSRKYNNKEKMHTVLGTPYYVSPEVLKGDYDEKCDVWSIGAITYIMLCGEPAFNGNSNNEIFNRIVHEEISFAEEKWKGISEESKDFIKKCMMKKPELRFSTVSAIEHPWFKNILQEVHSSQNFSPEILQNLRNFSTPQKLKKMVLGFLVNQLSNDELAKLRQAFYAIDIDHKGLINIDELEQAFKLANISISHEEVQRILETADDKNGGRLDYSEFLIASLNQKKFVDKEKLFSAFKYFDVDDSGYIDSSDLKNAFLRSGKQVQDDNEIDKILEEVSQQKLSLQEFLKLFGYE